MNFEFATAQRILFGAGAASKLPALVQDLGRRPMLLTGAHPDRLPKSIAHLASLSIPIAGEPTFQIVRNAVRLAQSEQCDCLIAVGGGSVIDAGKAISMILANGGDPLDFAEIIGAGRPITQPSFPLIAVPTTAGAGAEVTRNAVLTSPEHQLKVSLRSPRLLPSVALIDPALTLDLPPVHTAATGMDALAQVIEPFVSARANPITDALCRDGIARIARALPIAYSHPLDQNARSDMALGALLGGLALANGGLGAVHGFASPIGGMFSAPHGAVCAALLAPVFAANARAVPNPSRFLEIARLLTGSPLATLEDAVSFLQRLTGDLAIPKLSFWGLSSQDIPKICAKATEASSMKANPVPLNSETLENILLEAL